MKQDTDLNETGNSYNPLVLLQLIEKTVLAQTKDQYPFATIYDQKLTFYVFHQGSMTNPQWYERFDKKFYISKSIVVTGQHKALLEYVSQDSHSLDFDLCMEEQQENMRTDSKG